ncbi:probable protein phosphatase 2C 14 [Macadamia integrifolia]|uniref:probable protein phosphatase 2C 14 n=1 Tax=Macadamia integrifolia TaxID=60698 RepID=UPI001C4F7BC6|nr:probable protein phosphatase 2C 14 [Macadamia integrifolia]
MPSISVATEDSQMPLGNPVVAQFRYSKERDSSILADVKNSDVRPSSPSSFATTVTSSTTSLCLSLKRKRPPNIEIPQVLREIQTDEVLFKDKTIGDQPLGFDGGEVGVSSMKGKKKVMEDTHKIVSALHGDSRKGFFGVYDGHGGTKAAEFAAENLHRNILEMLDKCSGCMHKEDAIKAAYLKTDKDFLKQGLGSGTCCVTALIEGDDIFISNLGDCRAVLCRDGMAEVLTKDHRAGQEDERNRIEDKGGYVEIHRGAWRVHGILSVSRSIGDVHLKDWVIAEPVTKTLHLTPDMEFLVLATDGLWEKVSGQEAVDTITRSCLAANKQRPTDNLWKEDDEFGCENLSPPSKARRISLVKQQKVKIQSQSKESGRYKKNNLRKDENVPNGENLSPSSKLQRISLIKQHKVKIHLQNQENNNHQQRNSSGLKAACKELVNLAVSRGSLDDVTVMIINLMKFQCIHACFSSGEKSTDDPAAVSRSGQSVFVSVYRTKIAGQCCLITITWCKNLLLHGLSVSVEGPEGESHYNCKVEMKPWYFWRKHGTKRFIVEGKAVDVFWDLKIAKFDGKTEPQSDYYVAVVCEEEVVLLLGDLKKDAYRKTRSRPALIEPILVSRKEHIFAKKKFSTRVKFHEKGRFHEISIECNNLNQHSSNGGLDPEMEIKIDGHLAIHVKHLQWKFRGNESISMSKFRVEVYWDVHDWLFSPGLRHALFIFRPILISTSSSSTSISSSPPTTTASLTSTPLSSFLMASSSSLEGDNPSGSFGFCLFLYAWKVE